MMLLIAVGMAKQLSSLSLWFFIASTIIKSLYFWDKGLQEPIVLSIAWTKQKEIPCHEQFTDWLYDDTWENG